MKRGAAGWTWPLARGEERLDRAEASPRCDVTERLSLTRHHCYGASVSELGEPTLQRLQEKGVAFSPSDLTLRQKGVSTPSQDRLQVELRSQIPSDPRCSFC